MRVEWEGTEYDFDPEAISVQQMSVIHAATGLGWVDLMEQCARGHPGALQGVMWAMRTQAGERVDLRKLDFAVGAFLRAFGEGSAAEEVDEQPDPPVTGDRPAEPIPVPDDSETNTSSS